MPPSPASIRKNSHFCNRDYDLVLYTPNDLVDSGVETQFLCPHKSLKHSLLLSRVSNLHFELAFVGGKEKWLRALAVLVEQIKADEK